jgi:hypothetical protein
MATKKIEIRQDIYQIKVTLLGTNPPIWRRLLVPAVLTLAQLHLLLQTTMGWQDGHMHEFRVGHQHFGPPNPEDRSMGMPPVENERTARLSSVLHRVGARVIYTYDLAIAGSTASSWRSDSQLTRLPSLQSAPMVSLRVRRKIVGASPDFTILWRPSLTPATNGTRK